MLTCGTCINNDDLFCDLLGRLVEDDDEACKRYAGEPQKENQENGKKEST